MHIHSTHARVSTHTCTLSHTQACSHTHTHTDTHKHTDTDTHKHTDTDTHTHTHTEVDTMYSILFSAMCNLKLTMAMDNCLQLGKKTLH